MSRTILVAGATGDVGTQVVRALRERGARVRALVRTTSLADASVESIRGDLADRDSLDRALEGVEAACFVTPHSANEARLGHNFIDACETARVRRLVYISAFHPHSNNRIMQRLLDGVIGLIGPHYRAKLAVERRVRRTAMSPVALCPSNFFQNDEVALPEIRGGTYPHPIGQHPANRVDTRDIGDAAARALLDDIAPGAYPVVGPAAFTGPQLAAVWSAALGIEVTYGGNDLALWRSTVAPRYEPAKAADFARTYRVIQRFGIPVNARLRAQTEALLGRPPRAFEAYACEVAAREFAASLLTA